MDNATQQLKDAEEKAATLFREAETRGFILPGISEKQLNEKLYALAFELFGIKKYWHKRIVRAGKNTLLPYAENPPDLVLQNDDILFFDFGPVFEAWEADFGRTYVLGTDERKLKLKADAALLWEEGKSFFEANKETLSCADLFRFTEERSRKMGYEYGNEHCGHLIGNFPHEQISGDEIENYLHPENPSLMLDLDKNGIVRHWIYEIHLVNRDLQIGAFFEQLLY